MLLRAGRWDEAQEAILSALKIENFRYAEASYNLGRVYAAKGQNDLAAREWRRALKVDPQHDAATQALGRVGTDERIVVVSRPARASEKIPEPVAQKRSSVVKLQLPQSRSNLIRRVSISCSERAKHPNAVSCRWRLITFVAY